MKFKKGDRVKIYKNIGNRYRCAWVSPSMDKQVGKCGTIHSFTDYGNIRIILDGNKYYYGWVFHPDAVILLDRQLEFSFMRD